MTTDSSAVENSIRFYRSSAAFEHLKGLYKGQISRVDMLNRDRHMVLYLKDGQILYCLFKTEFIHSFSEYAGDLIRKYPQFRGHGESINSDWLFYARRLGGVDHRCRLVYIYRDGRVYSVYPNQVLNASIVREQNKVNTYIEYNKPTYHNEKEYWFSIKLLMPLEVEA